MKKAFEDYMVVILKLAKTNSDSIQVQYLRLKDFEARNIEDPDNCQNIPHADILYLKSEVSRYEISVAMVVSIKDSILEMCNKMENEKIQNEKDGNDLILPDVISSLEGALATLTGQAKIDIPRTTKNVDTLEAHLVK